MSFRSLYYNNTNITRSPKLAVKYIKQKTEFKHNIKKVLEAIKIILSDDNKNYFKNKNNINQL
jgi:hypothetical protein